jgi:hypothetical protein
LARAYDPNDPLIERAQKKLGVANWRLVPAILRGLRSNDENTRRVCIYAASALGRDAEAVVPALVALLDDPECSDPHQVLVIMAIHRLGPLARAAAPVLLEKMRTVPRVIDRVTCAWLHLRVTGQAEPALEIWAEAIDRGELRWVAVAANHLGPEAHAALPLFERWLARPSKDEEDMLCVAMALDRIAGRERAVEVIGRYRGEPVAARAFARLDQQRRED